MRPSWRWWILLAPGLVAPPGCGGASSDGGGGGYTLETLCDSLPETLCALRRGCCEATHGYDEAGCVARERTECEGTVAKAQAGDYTFDASKIDPCLAALGPYVAKCRPSLAEALAVIPQSRVCQFIFVGTRDEGEGCVQNEDCAPAVGDDASTYCDEDTRRCTTFRVLREGDACSLAAGASGLCAAGLYCDLAAGAAGGTCERALAIGAACSGPASLQCGLGQYCASGVCAAAKPAGGDCSQPPEALACASIECTAGQCAERDPVVDPDECHGD
ncbi:MAG: hypothetical protein IT376_08695 [Polyangiaceae bacterium]|nr:hypothetical protein [Polyangiaceae bacterium]